MSEQPATATQEGNQGFVLVWVLGSILILASILTPFAVFARIHFLTVINSEESFRFDLLADGISTLVLARLPDTAPAPQALDGTRRWCRIDDYTVGITLQDHAGLIDLNGAPEALLAAGFRAAGLGNDDAGATAQTAIRYRDRSYRADMFDDGTFALKQAPFEAVAELKELPSLREIESGILLDIFTVHAHQGTVSRPFTPPPLHRVLAARSGHEAGDSEKPFVSDTITVQVEIWTRDNRLAGYSEKVVAMEPQSGEIIEYERRRRRAHVAMPEEGTMPSCKAIMGIDTLG